MSETPETDAILLASTRIPDLRDREIDVLKHLLLGHSNRQIASRLGISEFTVKVHVGNALKKLDLESRLQLGIAAYIHLTGCKCLESRLLSSTA
ncbi:regulatory protein, luxR family [Sinosporangium album]|uniref:Regulatory protein, luxR family n=1 Tax=Sinosporangium album TaxID=504805 RepID=A0A1G8EUY3_9ACTN|nr:LuxR C-terminal-related transcriptional regulator [Sinosporangium album]SDH73688.1 regulatory protein, luxR family [Sinosporangium album]